MEKYQLKLWFEHGGGCIWSINEKTKLRYGYFVDINMLPISLELKEQLYILEKEYESYLDWNYPPNPSPWSIEHKTDFKRRAERLYECLCIELGCDYKVFNEIDFCI